MFREKIKYGKSTQKLLNDYKLAVDATTILSTSNPQGIITYANKKFCEISGYTLDELIGKPHSIVRHPDTPKQVFKEMWRTISSGKVWNGTIKNRAKDGSEYIVEAAIIPVTDENGEIEEYIGIRHDITAQYASSEDMRHELATKQERIKELTMTDQISGLPNQEAFCDTLKVNCGEQLSLIAFKIDHLSHIKDVLGFEFADAYLKELSATVLSFFAEFGNKLGVFRIDSDEMCVVFKGAMQNMEKTVEDFAAMARFFYATHKDISINSPVTIAAYTGDTDVRHKILTLLSYAFDKHRGEYIIGNEDTSCFIDEHPVNIFWLGKYSDAIAYEQMVPFFQPIMDNSTGKIQKYECLARILDNGKIISPDKFIDLATKARQIPFLTKAIVRRAFEKFSEYPELEFSINVSAMDLQDDFLLKQVGYWQEKTMIDPSRVVFEILETEDIYRYGILKKSIAKLKEMGYKIAIDDFGTGYSNFISLFEYKVDYIKIDGSLIKGLSDEPHKIEMVKNLNSLIHMCGAKSIAEFVSDEKIQNIAKEIGVDYSQGYYIGKPSMELKP